MRFTLFIAAWLAYKASAAPSKPASPPAGFDLPLIRDPVFGYLGNVSVGTPAQKLTVFLDWTWTSQYLISTSCSNETAPTGKCLSPLQQVFNQSRSSSFVDETAQHPDQTWYPNEFLPAPFEVGYGSDTMKVGPASSPITLQLSDIELGLLVQTPLNFGGIMGLMPSGPKTPVTQQSFFYQQYKANAWKSPYSAFVTCDHTKCPKGADAIQTFGGYSTKLASKGLHWYPVVPVPTVNQIDFPTSPGIFNYWAAELSSVSIGGEKQALNNTARDKLKAAPAAIFDHASKGRGLPLSGDAFARLVKMSNATLIPKDSPLLKFPPNNGMQPFYGVDCSTVNKLPMISYVFEGSPKAWNVTSAAYVARSQGKCILDVRVLGEGSWQLGNFGDNFLKGKYIVFDYEKSRIGLAEL